VGLSGLSQGSSQPGCPALLRNSVNHLQAVFGFVSLWSSEGEESQRHRRAEGQGTADEDEKHDSYKSISNAVLCPISAEFLVLAVEPKAVGTWTL
jgi:hypothetical protein